MHRNQLNTPDKRVHKKFSKDDLRTLHQTAANSLGVKPSTRRTKSPAKPEPISPLSPNYYGSSALAISPSAFSSLTPAEYAALPAALRERAEHAPPPRPERPSPFLQPMPDRNASSPLSSLPIGISTLPPPIPPRSSRRPPPPLVAPYNTGYPGNTSATGENVAEISYRRTPVPTSFSTFLASPLPYENLEHDEPERGRTVRRDSSPKVASVAETARLIRLSNSSERICPREAEFFREEANVSESTPLADSSERIHPVTAGSFVDNVSTIHPAFRFPLSDSTESIGAANAESFADGSSYNHPAFRSPASDSTESIGTVKAESFAEEAPLIHRALRVPQTDPTEGIRAGKVESCPNCHSIIRVTESVVSPTDLPNSVTSDKGEGFPRSAFAADSNSGLPVSTDINRHEKIDLRTTTEYEEDAKSLIGPTFRENADSSKAPGSDEDAKSPFTATNSVAQNPRRIWVTRPYDLKSSDAIIRPLQPGQLVPADLPMPSPTKPAPPKSYPMLRKAKSFFVQNKQNADIPPLPQSRREFPVSQALPNPVFGPSSKTPAGNRKPETKPAMSTRPSLQRLTRKSPDSSVSTNSARRTFDSENSTVPTTVTAAAPAPPYITQSNACRLARPSLPAIRTQNAGQPIDRKRSAQNFNADGKKKTRISRYVEKFVDKINAIGTSPVDKDPDAGRKMW